MAKKMLINATHPEENRVAIVEDGILTELDIEIAGKEQSRGNIYKAAVVRVEPGLQAAFVNYGGERFGFLQMGEIHPLYFRGGDSEGDGRRQRITDVLRRGQELLVQVVKEERGTKGAALTTFISLPGRFMVLMPDSDTKGVSRKIEDEGQRKKLKEAMASLDLPEKMGYIVRTAGIGQKKEELKRDFNYLVRVWEKIREESRQTPAPALIYKESNLVIRSIRDYFAAEMDEVLVDDPRVCQEAKDFFQQVMPEYARLVKLHQEKRPIFSRYQIEEQIETISKNKVPLPSGGSIVIDSTEALVAVDVNSGKMAGEQNVEATAYKTNLEAATETARQLRLRDLGGLIVIDFIDMRDRKHIREIEKCLKDSLKYDKARVTVGRISQFGMLEMSRQRIKATLAEGSFLPCPHCHGGGRIKSPEAQAIAFLRKLHGAVAKGQIGRVEGEVPLEVATYLLNSKREELVEMERRHQLTIVIKGRPDFLAGQAELSTQKREKDELPTLDLPALPVLPSADLPTRLPAAEPVAPKDPVEATPAVGTSPAEAVSMPTEAAEMTEEVETGDESADTEETSAEETGKKKRKRRRRKKKNESLPADETAVPEVPESEATTGLPEPVEGEALAAGEAGEKRKKKRRRKKKKSGEAAVETAGAEELAATGMADETDEEGSEIELEEVVAGEAGEERKKKRRRRRKKKPAIAAEPAAESAEAVVEPETSAEPATTELATQPVAANPTLDAELKPAAKVRRSRKMAEKPESTATETAPAAESVPALPTPTEVSLPAPKPSAQVKKAKSPRSRKGAENGGQVPDSEAPETPVEPSAPSVEPASTEAKPSRRRSTRQPAAGSKQGTQAATTETAAAPEMEMPVKQEAPVATDTAAEKPKRRPPRKKAPVNKNTGDETLPS